MITRYYKYVAKVKIRLDSVDHDLVYETDGIVTHQSIFASRKDAIEAATKKINDSLTAKYLVSDSRNYSININFTTFERI